MTVYEHVLRVWLPLARRWGHAGCSKFMHVTGWVHVGALIVATLGVVAGSSRLTVAVCCAAAVAAYLVETMPYACYVRYVKPAEDTADADTTEGERRVDTVSPSAPS